MIASAFCLALSPLLASQAPELPFPLHPVTTGGAADLVLATDLGALDELRALERVVLRGFQLPSGGAVDLALTRVTLATDGAELFVDGQLAAEGRAVLGDLTLWTGGVVGQPESSAFLGLSRHGSRGWVRTGGELWHLLAEPDVSAGWARPSQRVVSESLLLATGARPSAPCASDRLAQPLAHATVPRAPSALSAGPADSGAPGALLECRIALETDYQFFQVFNDLDATKTYAFTLLGAVNDRYREQIGVVLTLPYTAFYTQNNDPWDAQDAGGDCIAVLYEFTDDWDDGMPVDADLGHMLSGADLGCGVAFLDTLCTADYGYSISGNLSGQTPFPIAVGPLNWDFIVVAHEIGHNFSALHTHDYCPPLDECAPAGYFGACQTAEVCTTQGTVMSYCHLCGAGMTNMTTYFHPTSVADMRARAESSCLVPFEGVFADDLGFALAGSAGTPAMTAEWLDATHQMRLQFTNAPVPGPGFVVLGGTSNPLPIFGGTLVPTPDLVVGFGVPSASVAFTFPVTGTFPTGITFFAQGWFADLASASLVAASNALETELIVPTDPPALTWFKHPSNGREYALTPSTTWWGAEGHAGWHGGHLASIGDAALETWLVQTFYTSGLLGASEDVWLGFTDEFSEGSFHWTAGGSAAYTDWASGQPNDFGGFQDVVEWRDGGEWYDIEGYEDRRGVMERPATP